MPGLRQLLLLAEQPHSPACDSHLHFQESTISHGCLRSRVGSSSSWKECLSALVGTIMEEEGGFPQAVSLLTSSPCPLCSTSHKRTHTHTHPPPQRFWRRDQAEARWGRGGHGRAGITLGPALTLPPTGDRQSAAEARLPSGVVTCVLSVLEGRGGTGWLQVGFVCVHA